HAGTTADLTDTAGNDNIVFVNSIDGDAHEGEAIAHGFSNGDKIIYRATSGDSLSASTIAPLVDGGVYRVKVINSSTIQLKRNSVLTTQVNYVRSGGGDQIIRTDGNNWIDDCVCSSAGETILITGSSVNNGTWHIASASGATLTLTETNSVIATRVTTSTQ